MRKIMTKEQVEILNKIAREDFARAVAMLDGINLVLGTLYGWRGKRVGWKSQIKDFKEWLENND